MDATKFLVLGAIGVLVAIIVATTKVPVVTSAVAAPDDNEDDITPAWAANVPAGSYMMAPPLSYMMPVIADSPTALPSGPGCAMCS